MASETVTLPEAGTWTMDPAHSTIQFVARHLVVTKVRGRFSDYEGTLTVDPDPLKSKFHLEINTDSIDTGQEDRDAHLRTNDFFEVTKYPKITFDTTSIRRISDEEYEVTGDLTIKSTTKPVTVNLEYNGVTTDPWGGTRAGFSATTEINRHDFGVTFNGLLETGGAIVSDKIKIEIEAEAVKAA